MLKNTISFSLVLILLFSIPLTSLSTPLSPPPQSLIDAPILDLLSRKIFDYFWNEANQDETSLGYGLVPKGITGNNRNVTSTAGVGFGLAVLAIGAERGWAPRDAIKKRVRKTLLTLLNNVEHEHGFFYHFVDINTGQKMPESEASTVDTTRTISGAIVAGEYFGGYIKDLAMRIYQRADWEWFRDPNTNQLYKGYRPDSGFGTLWSNAGEQAAMYVLAAGSPTHPVNGDTFYSFTRSTGTYGNSPPIIHSFFGSMHTYMYSHAFVDFRNKVDRLNINWFENSRAAVKANRQYAIDQSGTFKTLGANSWGMMACKGPDGYEGKNGAPPSANNNIAHRTVGTVPPNGAVGAIVFTPEESIAALNNYYNNYPQLWGPYGFYDGFNLDVTPAWYADDYSVINLGGPMLMIENYRTGFVWKWFNNNAAVRDGMNRIGMTTQL